MKKKRIIVIVIFLLIIAAAALCYLYKPLYYRMYLGDRIKGELHVTIDSEPAMLSDYSVSSDSDGFSTKADGDATKISIKGGSYGGYSFAVNIPGVDIPLEITVFQHNWWNVAIFEMNIAVSTENNTASCSYKYTWIEEDGTIREDTGTSDDLFVFLGG